jgi:hypothetical protein
MEYQKLIKNIRLRPQMYGLDGSFGQYTAYVHGLDDGNNQLLLTGFREWLIVRLNGGNNLEWSGLVLHLAFPEQDDFPAGTLEDPERNRAATQTFFQCLGDFFEARGNHNGLVQIYDAYLAWLKAQSWYKPQE